jgi:hypothetical protein
MAAQKIGDAEEPGLLLKLSATIELKMIHINTGCRPLAAK